jgi:hypothetical protein
MYAIYIEDPATFSATTVGGATFDTQLWLFDANGKGVVANDDSGGNSAVAHRQHGRLYHRTWRLLPCHLALPTQRGRLRGRRHLGRAHEQLPQRRRGDLARGELVG